METKDRTKTEVSIELREVQREISKARSTRNWAKISFLNQKRIRLQEDFTGIRFTAYEVVPTFTLQDIISMLPDSIDNNILTIRKNANVVSVSYENLYTRSILSISQEDSLIKSSYEMLVWCLSYGIIKTNNKTE